MSSLSCVEATADAVATWIGANFPTYLARANLGKTYQAPALAKCEVMAYIPDTGPYPYMMINVDDVKPVESGQGTQKDVITMSANMLVTNIKKENIGRALTRYMDALIDALAVNLTLGGAVDHIWIDTIDKGEMPAEGRGFIIATLIAEKETANQ